MARGQAYFGRGLFEFLMELKANNNRGWFDANKERYERDVKEPMLRFITDFGERLRAVNPNFRADARPVGGSMFRIYRDVRFSRDKSPYKTNVGAHFPHTRAGKDVHAPGFYLHLAPGESMGGGGLWHPDPTALKRVRDRIVARPQEWKKARAGMTLHGDALKRVPAGYDAQHPFAEDLKRKDLYLLGRFSDREVYAPDFMDHWVEECRAALPLVQFLTKAVGLPW